MTARSSLCRSAVMLALGVLAGCTATPRYPVDGGPAGEGFQPIAPQYPIEAPPPRAPIAAEAPIRSRALAPPSDEARLATSQDVEEASLPTLSRSERRTRADPRPSFASRAPTTAETPEEAPAPRVRRIPGAMTYTLVHGDTLYGVARRFGVGPLALASANGLSAKKALQPGMKLKLPAESHDGGDQVHATGKVVRAAARVVTLRSTPRRLGSLHLPTPPPQPRTPSSEATPSGPIPYTQLVGHEHARSHREPPAPYASPDTLADRSEASPLPAIGGEANSAVLARAARGRFIRPVHGETLSTFGAKGPGQRNDGVDLGAREGEVVRASAAGVVVYAGHDVPALGNLVAVKHADGWVTVYGELEKITVKPTERLAQGAPLGVAGATNLSPTPQVHFEVRYAADPSEKAHPVDPDLVLPKGS